MQEVLANPEIQSSLLPLVCSLLIALLASRAGSRWLGLGIIAGFLLTVSLSAGLGFQPLTSTRKIILCSVFLPVLGIILDWRQDGLRVCLAVLAAVLAMAALWVVWPVLMRQQGLELWLLAGRVGLYAAAIGAGLMWFGRQAIYQQGGAILGLGIATGAVVLVSASALYAQLSFAVAAAMGGVLLVVLLAKPTPKGLGNLGIFAAAAPLALLGGAATVYAKLPPLALLFLMLVPAFAAIPLVRHENPWLRCTVSTLLALLPALPAFWLSWRAAGPMVY